jgi:tetratricopeptide (TPR) repeat protein
MAHLTRHELKHRDEFARLVGQSREFLAQHGRQITIGLVLAILMVGGAGAFRYFENRDEAKASMALGHALRIFHGYVESPETPQNAPANLTFATEDEKFDKALEKFTDVFAQFPKRKAGGIARTYMGLCQSRLGRHPEALKTLEEASRFADAEVASFALFSLAGEKIRAGASEEAEKIYKELLDRKSPGVARPVVQMALADSIRSSRPAEARKIYEELQVQFPGQPQIAASLKSLQESLPQSK